MSELVIFDNHIHLSYRGRHVEAVKEFKKYGGTHLNFCPYTDVRRIAREKSYMGCYEEGIKLAKEAEEKSEIKIFLTIGPYPVDYLKLRETIGRGETMQIMRRGMEEAAELCKEGMAIAIGEIGRPHFKVDEEAWNDSNEIMKYGMELAKEVGVPVILHMEKATPENMKEIAEMARKVGLKEEKVIKHYSPPLIKPEENYGIFPSVIAKEENIREAFKKGKRFMLETDFLDDLKRPGAVLDIRTIPKKLRKLLQQGEIGEEDIMVINKDNPEKIYGISLD